MKKVLFIVAMCFAFVSCGTKITEEDKAIQNAINLKNEIKNEMVVEISRHLKDPSSLKFAESIISVDKVANPIDIKNNENISFLFEDGYDYYTIIMVEYYAKNGFGAYNGTNDATLLFKVKITNTDENGINDYFVNAVDISAHPNWLDITKYLLEIEHAKESFYENEISPKNIEYLMEVSSFIRLPDEMVM